MALGFALHNATATPRHFIMTPAHDDDLDLCHRLLQRGFWLCGLIGSDTKCARFRSRLAGLGHAPEQIARITVPHRARQLASIPSDCPRVAYATLAILDPARTK